MADQNPWLQKPGFETPPSYVLNGRVHNEHCPPAEHPGVEKKVRGSVRHRPVLLIPFELNETTEINRA